MKARGLDEGVAGQEPERGQKEAGRRRMEREEVLGWGQLVALQAGEGSGFCSESGHRWRDFDQMGHAGLACVKGHSGCCVEDACQGGWGRGPCPWCSWALKGV